MKFLNGYVIVLHSFPANYSATFVSEIQYVLLIFG